MDRITDLKIIEHFYNEEFNMTCGIYNCKFNGKNETFIRNNNSVSAICFYYNRNSDKCLSIVKADVRDELLKKVNDMLEE